MRVTAFRRAVKRCVLWRMLRLVALSLVLAGCHAPRTVYLRNVSGSPMLVHRAEAPAFFDGQPVEIPLEASGAKRTWLISYPTEARWSEADRDALARALDLSEVEVGGTRVSLKGHFSISMYGGPVNELFVRIENPAPTQ